MLTKCQRLGDLKQQKFIISEIWNLEVQNQGVKVDSSRRL